MENQIAICGWDFFSLGPLQTNHVIIARLTLSDINCNLEDIVVYLEYGTPLLFTVLINYKFQGRLLSNLNFLHRNSTFT